MTTQTETDTPTAAQIELRMAAIENGQDAARIALEEAQAAYGDAVLGKAPSEADKAAKRVKEQQADLERLQAAHEALQRRLVAAREREAIAAHAAKWDAFADALGRRSEACDRMRELAGPFFRAVDAAIDVAEEVRRLAPCEKVQTPSGWQLMGPLFGGLSNLRREELVVVKNALNDLTKRARPEAENALRMRQFDKPLEQQATPAPAEESIP